MIKDLRRLGGTWTAERYGFGVYVYHGNWKGAKWKIQSFAHMAPRFDGDDDNFKVLWHITKNGEPVGFPSKDPVLVLKYWSGA